MKLKLSLSCIILFCFNSIFGQTITTTGTLSAVPTTYGAPSATPTSFVTGGTGLTSNLIITAPTGFEVSSTSATAGYSGSINLLPNLGAVSNTTIYVRLTATIGVGSYGGAGVNVAVSSTGATMKNVPTVASSVAKANLTIKADGATKTSGATLTGGTGRTSFKATGLQNGETAGTVTITYGAGASAGDGAGTYTNQVSASALTGGTMLASNYNISYLPGNIVVGTSTITVNALPQALSTTFGSASGTTTGTISGSNLSNDITVTPPAGFETSQNSTGPFAGTVTLTQSSGGVGTTNVYYRLAATTNVGNNYGGDVVISSPGATSKVITLPTSTVNAAAITITANNATKDYGTTLTGGAGSTDFTLSNGTLKNSNTLSSVSIAYGSGSAAADGAGTYNLSVTPSAVIGANGFLASNYTITYGKGNITVNKAPVTVNLAGLAQTYDGTAKPVTASASGASGTSTFTYTYNGSSTEPITAGTYPVVATLLNANFSGTASGSLIIDKAGQVITFPTFAAKDTASPDFEPGASTTSNLAITYASSNTAVAEVYQDAGDGNKWKIKVKGVGTSDINALQAGNSNYNASSFLRELTVNPSVLPVSVVSYTAKIVNGAVKLEWQTSSETNNKGFVIYRSGDDKVVKTIGEVIAEGNSTTIKNYSFFDRNPLPGTNYYSLVQLDNDGKITAVGDRSIRFGLSTVSHVKLYPNPTNETVNLVINSHKGTEVKVVIIDLRGRVIHTETIKLSDEVSNYRLNLNEKLAAGQYIVNVTGEGFKDSLKLIAN